VYLFKDESGAVLYVGKARDLSARLQSYRRPGGDGRLALRFLERDAASVETIVTRTEAEALLLEDQLVKRLKPPHNVRLKDDKSFLMVRVDLGARFPRLELVRAHRPDEGRKRGRSRSFGPFASAGAVRRTLSDIHRVVPLRDCPDAVMEHRTRPCLKHQLGLCAAPCVGLIDQRGYAALVERALAVLAGDTAELERELEGRMNGAAAEMEYERAAAWRDRLAALRATVERQGVAGRDRAPRDAIGLARLGASAAVHRLSYREGRLAQSRSHAFRSELPDGELMHVVLSALYAAGRREAPAEILVPCPVAEATALERALETALVVPASGERQRMLDLATENALAALGRQGAAAEEAERALDALARLLGLSQDADLAVIDGFDVSNLQGAHAVASRGRFRHGLPDRGGYRHYRIKSVAGQDDFAALAEAVGRSLRRGAAEDELPQLVVVDGGAQQLASALAARDDAGAFGVRVVALAKARPERRRAGARKAATEERLVLAPDGAPLELARHSPARHLLERLRDEAHRFAITFHRKTRGRIQSQLDSIPGVGPARRRTLIKAFGSVLGVRGASVEQLAALPGIGRELALAIRAALERREPHR
jgi:excinuclease ABC subunit C